MGLGEGLGLGEALGLGDALGLGERLSLGRLFGPAAGDGDGLALVGPVSAHVHVSWYGGLHTYVRKTINMCELRRNVPGCLGCLWLPGVARHAPHAPMPAAVRPG